MKENKYFYCFKPDLGSHIHFYSGWVNTARKNGLPIKLISFVRFYDYIRNYDKVKELKRENDAVIVPTPRVLRKLIMMIYFVIVSIRAESVVVHLKKVDPNVFKKLKKVNSKIKYIIDIEGDPEAERDYLINHSFKPGFYNEIINNLEIQIINQGQYMRDSNYIFCVTNHLKKNICNKFPEVKGKIGVLPTGVDSEKFYFDGILRGRIRVELGLEDRFIIIFTGNIFYSWQNIHRTLEVFKIIKTLKPNAFLILLIKKDDIPLAKEFIKKVNINPKDILLRNVSNNQVNAFLNAADLGILLRHDHLMNKVASPGKIGEYAVSGLPILATRPSTIFAEKLSDIGQMILIENMDSDEEIKSKIIEYDFNNIDRLENSNESIRLFSNQSYVDEYVYVMQNII
ncbi:glycosyltransferase [Bacillus sp. 1P02SD]|uniref:glycosyltransferase n=1 Tax=Bacillus sp. 1P02SD TaxID=3132264 RepID=UPI00399F21BD